jgi:hypothetical protein
MPGFNPIPSSIQISRMLRRPPAVGGIGFHSGIKQAPFPLKRALGGSIPDNPMTPVIGAINTATPGRADAHPTHVPPGSYVMPADLVSMIGEGNTAAGQAMLAKMFLPIQAQSTNPIAQMRGGPPGGGGAPFGAEMPGLRSKPMGPPRPIEPTIVGEPKYPIYAGPGKQGPNFVQAHGGVVQGSPDQPGTPINISGGEFVIPPQEVKRRGRGDINRGHEILDAWMKDLRQEHIKTLKKLPGPAT